MDGCGCGWGSGTVGIITLARGPAPSGARTMRGLCNARKAIIPVASWTSSCTSKAHVKCCVSPSSMLASLQRCNSRSSAWASNQPDEAKQTCIKHNTPTLQQIRTTETQIQGGYYGQLVLRIVHQETGLVTPVHVDASRECQT
jgi:hypothetical protein